MTNVHNIKLKTAVLAVIFTASLSFSDIVFYGATKITVPINTGVNVKTDAMYRIFARCDYDGDISHLITITDISDPFATNTVNTLSQGTKTVTYSVTNSQGDTKEITVPVVVGPAGTITKVERTVYILPKSAIEAIQIAGARRGDNQDRQHLGIYMPLNSTLTIKKVDANFTDPITINAFTGVYNDNARNNTLGAQTLVWTPAAANNNRGRIPFIVTPRSDNVKTTVVEVEVSGNVKGLDYYHYKDDNYNFYSYWQGHYALLGNSAALLMVSIDDRTNYGATILMNKLDELLEFYEDFCALFNRFHGLDIDDANPNHKLVHTKYFVVPQIDGPGGAFYNENLTGMSGRDALNGGGNPGFLGILEWVTLHEFGHGYDGSFASKEISMKEVVNNVSSHYYQASKLDLTTAEGRKLSWAFNYNNSSAQSLDNTQKDGSGELKNLNSLGLREKLWALINMYDGAGGSTAAEKVVAAGKTYAAAQRLNREATAKGQNWYFSELNARAFDEAANVNIVPFLEAYGLGENLSPVTRARAYEENNRIAYFLERLAGSQTQSVISGEGLYTGGLSLIKPDSRGLNGTAGITINIDDLNSILGKKLKIKDGAQTVFETEITSNKVEIPSLPIGAYYIQVPKAESGLYKYDYEYLTIKNGEKTSKTIDYEEIAGIAAASAMYVEVIGFRGNSNPDYSATWFKATVRYDAPAGKLSVQTSGYGSFPFAQESGNSNNGVSVEVLREGQRIYFKGYPNNAKTPTGIEYADVQIGDIVKIFSELGATNNKAYGQNSLTMEKNFTDYTFNTSTPSEFEITPYGLMPKNASQQKKRQIFTESFNLLLDETKGLISPQKWADSDAYKGIKAGFIYGVELLSEEDKQRFIDENADLFGGEGLETPISKTNSVKPLNFAITGITAAGRLNLTVPTAGNYSVAIYSVDGRMLAQTKANLVKGANTLPLNKNFAKGVAIVRVRGVSTDFVKKIMVK